ncbi:protein of unknown function [Burkholderia multivorans]
MPLLTEWDYHFTRFRNPLLRNDFFDPIRPDTASIRPNTD